MTDSDAGPVGGQGAKGWGGRGLAHADMLMSKSLHSKACRHLPLCRAGPCSYEQCRSRFARSDPPPSLTSLAVRVFPSATNTCSKNSFQGDKVQVAVISQGPRGAALILWEPASLFSARHGEAPCRPFPETRRAATAACLCSGFLVLPYLFSSYPGNPGH